MKIVFRGLLFCLMVANVVSIRADLQRELVSLQQHLTALGDALQKPGVLKPSTGGTLLPLPEPTPSHVGAGGGKVIPAPKIETNFQFPKTSDAGLNDLLRNIKVQFNDLANAMNHFIFTLVDYIQPGIHDRSQVLDVLVVDLNKMAAPEAELTKLLQEIDGKLNAIAPVDAGLIAQFLYEIMQGINQFYTYVDNIYNQNENAWQQIRLTYKGAFQEEANVQYHFYNAILMNDAFASLNPTDQNGIYEEFKRAQDRFMRHSKIKPTGGAAGGAAAGKQQGTGIPFTLAMPKIPFFTIPDDMPKLSQDIINIDSNFTPVKEAMELISAKLMPTFIDLLAKNADINAVVEAFRNLRMQFNNLQNFEGDINGKIGDMEFAGFDEVEGQEAKLVSEYLNKILQGFLNFGVYIQKVDQFIKVNYPQARVGIMEEYRKTPTVGLAPKYFNEYIMQSNAVKDIIGNGDLVKNLRTVIVELNKVSGAASGVAGGQPTEKEIEAAKDAVTYYDILEEEIETGFKPAFEAFAQAFNNGQAFKEEYFKPIKTFFQGISGVVHTQFDIQTGKLELVLRHINNAQAFDKRKLEDMYVYLDDFIEKIKSWNEKMQGTVYGKRVGSILTSGEFEIAQKVVEKLKALVDQVAGQPTGGGVAEAYKENPWLGK